MGQKEPFGSLWGYAANTSETFRTVSLGNSVNKGKKEGKRKGRSTTPRPENR
jgi:hypothetical protein